MAAALLREDPEASLRQIARRAGISPSTVAVVRDQMARDNIRTSMPVPPGDQRPGTPPTTPQSAARAAGPMAADVEPPSVGEICGLLRRDPSLRFSDAGRSVLRLLEASAAVAGDSGEISAAVPPHCRPIVAQLATLYAQSWQHFAEKIQRSGAV